MKKFVIELEHEYTGYADHVQDHHQREGETLVSAGCVSGGDMESFVAELIDAVSEGLAYVNQAASAELSDPELALMVDDFVRQNLDEEDYSPEWLAEADPADLEQEYPNCYIVIRVKAYEPPKDRIVPGVLYKLSRNSGYFDDDHPEYEFAVLADQSALLPGMEGYYTADMWIVNADYRILPGFEQSPVPVNIANLEVYKTVIPEYAIAPFRKEWEYD